MMENYIHLSPAEIITEFGRKIRNFSAGEPLRDDITMIVIKKKISMGQKVTGMQSIIDCDPVYEQDGSEISHRGETI